MLLLTYRDDTIIEIDDLVEVYDSIKKISNGESKMVLVELFQHTSFSTEAREFGQVNELSSRPVAVVIKTLGQRIQFNFYAKFRRQKNAIASFKDRETAYNWLVKQKKKE
jgi:hypothetical protein